MDAEVVTFTSRRAFAPTTPARLTPFSTGFHARQTLIEHTVEHQTRFRRLSRPLSRLFHRRRHLPPPRRRQRLSPRSAAERMASIALDDYSRSVRNVYQSYSASNPNMYQFRCDQRQNDNAPMWNHHHYSAANWYRFTGSAGERMPTEPPGGDRCGTSYAGWLASPHPQVGDAPRVALVCYHRGSNINSNQCYYQNEIQTCACSYDGS